MSTPSQQDLRTWTVTLDTNQVHTVRAIYFRTEDAYTVFKEHDGKAVFAAPTSRILSIVREQTTTTRVDHAISVDVRGNVLTERDLAEAATRHLGHS